MNRRTDDDGPPWFKRIGIGKTCEIVAMHAGLITLTVAPDGTHTLWMMDHQLASGPAQQMRNRYADHMPGHWLEGFYRS